MVTSDIDRLTPRTEELAATVTHAIFAQHVPMTLTGLADTEAALRKLRRTLDNVLVVTMGEHGASALDGDRFYHEPAFMRARGRHDRRRRRLPRRLHLRARQRPADGSGAADRERRRGRQLHPSRRAQRRADAGRSPRADGGRTCSGDRDDAVAVSRRCSTALLAWLAPAAAQDHFVRGFMIGRRRRSRRRPSAPAAPRCDWGECRARIGGAPRVGGRQVLAAPAARSRRGDDRVSDRARAPDEGPSSADHRSRSGVERARRRARRRSTCRDVLGLRPRTEQRLHGAVDGADHLRAAEHRRQVHRPAAADVVRGRADAHAAVSTATR